ncbi:MAG: hypothetical protein QF707_07790 [Candidatus Poseidoniaceae archaeon]|nr:hypothetical protein [Candidatus Poseidoniaceae archaeon]
MDVGQLAILIPALPIAALPVILLLGRLFNGNEKWKREMKIEMDDENEKW